MSLQPSMYGELVPWYRLIDPAEDHAEEAAAYEAAFERAISPPGETLLEIGCGAGHNALHLKARYRCALADLSDAMLGLSRELNPECEHFQGDMRTMRLGRTFDAVLIHDAITYMTSEEDLLAAMITAFVHTRPGGAAIFAPDTLRETFSEGTELLVGQDGDRALSAMEYSWDPDPADDTHLTEYVFLLRDGQEVRTVHDRHVQGLFSKAAWVRLLEQAGFRVEILYRPIDEGVYDEIFLGRRA